MSSLRVRNLIKRFSVNETESKFKSEAENQPNNTNNNTRISNSSSNNNSAMEASDSDSDVTDLERKIELLAQEKNQARIAVTTANNNNNNNNNNMTSRKYLIRISLRYTARRFINYCENSTWCSISPLGALNMVILYLFDRVSVLFISRLIILNNFKL